jgi:hypothetical protein
MVRLTAARPEGPVPDVARLLEVFLEWTPDPVLRQSILVDNPGRPYGWPHPVLVDNPTRRY